MDSRLPQRRQSLMNARPLNQHQINLRTCGIGYHFRVCIDLYQMISILTHVPAGPTPEAKAQIVWCKIPDVNCQVDIRIGTVGWSGRGNVMSLSRFDKLAGQYNSQ